MTASQNREGTSKKSTTKSSSPTNKDLETQMPLSEKDEVKKAEQLMNKNTKKR